MWVQSLPVSYIRIGSWKLKEEIPLYSQIDHHQMLKVQSGQTELESALTEGALAKYIPVWHVKIISFNSLYAFHL